MTRHIPTNSEVRTSAGLKYPRPQRHVNFLDTSFEINLSVSNVDIDENLVALFSCEIPPSFLSHRRKNRERLPNEK